MDIFDAAASQIIAQPASMLMQFFLAATSISSKQRLKHSRQA
jgi:hypothetical protein